MEYGWSLERIDWDEVPTTVSDAASWRAVQLTPRDAVTVPATSGVYVVCSGVPGKKPRVPPGIRNVFEMFYTAVYVGRTDDLRRRFEEHCSRPKPEISKSRECFGENLDFWFIRLDPGDIADVEGRLIKCLGPSANRIAGTIRVQIRPAVPA